MVRCVSKSSLPGLQTDKTHNRRRNEMSDKIKITRNILKNRFSKIFCCGYCDLQYIFHNLRPYYYNCGIYGWNYDVYANYCEDIAITTGYRGMFGTRIPAEIIKHFETEAKSAIENFSFTKSNLLDAALTDIQKRFFEVLKQL